MVRRWVQGRALPFDERLRAESQSYPAPQSEKSFHVSHPPREYDEHHLDNLHPRASAKKSQQCIK